jgi:hypothetical protein
VSPRACSKRACSKLALSGILGQGCSSQETSFLLWRAVEKSRSVDVETSAYGRVSKLAVAVTSGIEVCGAHPSKIAKNERVGHPQLWVTPFVYLFGLTTATLFTPLQAR